MEINASPEKVFAFVTGDEFMDLTKEWVAGKMTSDGPVGVGSTAHFSGVKFDKGGEWDAVVTEFTENKSFTMSLKGTKMTITMDYKMNKLLDVLFAHRIIEKENRGMLEKLKKTLEAQ